MTNLTSTLIGAGRNGPRSALRTALLLAGASLLVSIGACTGQSSVSKRAEYSAGVGPDDLLASNLLLGHDGERAEVMDAADVLAVNEEIRSFLQEYVDPKAGRFLRLQQLLRAVISDGSFGLVYGESTRTASATFASRAGNCLSFTNMFVAMAREVGLDASYQEVEVPPDWSMNGDTYILNRHVNVKVDIAATHERFVDFNIDDFKSSYERREISDERAYAHFFNNKGVEQMQAGDHAAAFRMFRTALELDRGFGPAWSNLGALYNRAGEPAYAEAAYLEALRLEPAFLLAMSNLARVYETQGDEELANYYRERARYHRDRNPYYRYELARQAFLERDYDEAIDHLEYAVRKKQWEDSFYFLLGLSYLQQGDERQARKWLDRAEQVAESEALTRNYQSKIDLLLSGGSPN